MISRSLGIQLRKAASAARPPIHPPAASAAAVVASTNRSYAANRYPPPTAQARSSPTTAPPKVTLDPSQPVPKHHVPPPPTRTGTTAPATATSAAVDANQYTPKGGKKYGVLQSWRNLSYNTKLVFCTSLAVFAILGGMVADRLQEVYPERNNRPAHDAGQEASSTSPKFIQHGTDTDDRNAVFPSPSPPPPKPRLFSISVVDRKTP